jgi:hypothetical protein
VDVYVYRRPTGWRGEWPPCGVPVVMSPHPDPMTNTPSLQSVQLSLWPDVA